jgi:hypothetical protein
MIVFFMFLSIDKLIVKDATVKGLPGGDNLVDEPSGGYTSDFLATGIVGVEDARCAIRNPKIEIFRRKSVLEVFVEEHHGLFHILDLEKLKRHSQEEMEPLSKFSITHQLVSQQDQRLIFLSFFFESFEKVQEHRASLFHNIIK